jgi:hypothetical protein
MSTSAKQLELAQPGAAEPTSLAGGILNIIARAASDPNTDVDKLERLLAMQERVMARDAEEAFNASLLAAQDEIRPIAKNKVNPDTKSKYADLSALAEGLDPIIRKHGFAQSFGTADCPIPGHYRVTCDMSHTRRPYSALSGRCSDRQYRTEGVAEQDDDARLRVGAQLRAPLPQDADLRCGDHR